jgi:hypothetical protein
MSWTIKRNPALPAEPTYQDPGRCMNCGHLGAPNVARGVNEAHDPNVGCLVPGGTKYLEDENGNGFLACNCDQFVPAPEAAEGAQ